MSNATYDVESAELQGRSLLDRILDRWFVKLAVTIIAVGWLVPTLGLLVSSFRGRRAGYFVWW